MKRNTASTRPKKATGQAKPSLVGKIKARDHVEFLSDIQTDKGPCCGTVTWVCNDLVCMHVSDDYLHMDQNKMLLDRVSIHARTKRPLWLLK